MIASRMIMEAMVVWKRSAGGDLLLGLRIVYS